MKKFIISFAHLFIVSITIAQVPAIQWQKTLGGNNNDVGQSILQTADGGFIVAGYTYSINGDVTSNHGQSDGWVVKLSNFGIIEWQKTFGGTDIDVFINIKQTADGSYILAGYTSSNNGDVSGNHGGQDAWVVKLSDSGVLQWQKCLGGSNLEKANSLELTTDGGCILACIENSVDGDVELNFDHTNTDIWVVKLSNLGTVDWAKSLGGSSNDEAYDIKQTTDGCYIVAGYTNSNNFDVSGNHGVATGDGWLAKLSSVGNIEWQKCLGGSATELINSIQLTFDGGYIASGYTSSNNGDVTGNHGAGDYWVVKLSNLGSLQWQKTLGGSNDDSATSIQPTADGGYIVAGSELSNNNDVSGNHGSYDKWIVKLSSSGNLQWQKAMGGLGNDLAQSIKLTSDGGSITTGYTFSNSGDVTGNHGTADVWIVKLAPDFTTAPLANSQTFCQGASVSNLVASGTALQWYDVSSGGSALFGSNVLVTGNYYVSQSLGGIESPRTIVAVTINANVNYYADTDGDSFGNINVIQVSCTGAPIGYVSNSLDCNDTNASIHPGAIEICGDGIDNDCNGVVDETCQTEIKATQWNTTLASLDTQIHAYYVPGYQMYRFEVSNGGTTNTCEVAKYNFDLTKVPGTAYATTYSIRVALKIGGTWGSYGNAHNVTTPALASNTVLSTKLLPAFCGVTLPALDTKIGTVPVYGVNGGYRFEITTGGVTTIYDSPSYNFRLAQAGVAAYGTTYTIRVAAQVNGIYGNYGASCNVSTPAAISNNVPTTNIIPSLCGTTLASKDAKITAIMINGATNGRYEITKSGSAPVVYEVASTVIKLSQTGVVVDYNTNYSIRVAAFVGGVWGNYGASCTVTTPAAPIVRIKSKSFEVSAYPNPFETAFNLNLETPSKEEVTIAIYDMMGKLVETHQVNPMEVANLQIGSNFAAGIYNVIVSQANEMQAIRLIRK